MLTLIHSHREDGQALVEFSIVLVIFSMIIFGIIELATLYSTRFMVSYATFIAARSAAVHSLDTVKVADDVSKLVLAGTVNPQVLIPGVNSLYLSTKAKVVGDSINVSILYRKPITTPLVGRVLNPLGSYIRATVKISSSVTIPIFDK